MLCNTFLANTILTHKKGYHLNIIRYRRSKEGDLMGGDFKGRRFRGGRIRGRGIKGRGFRGRGIRGRGFRGRGFSTLPDSLV